MVILGKKESAIMLLAVALLILLINLSSATTYYVATYGNNSSVGNITSPWRTIQYAANNVTVGDTVIVLNGTYNEDVATKINANNTNRITFIANDSNVSVAGFSITHIYYSIIGFNITYMSSSGTNAIDVTGGNGTEIINNTIAYVDGLGIFLRSAPTSNNVTVRGNIIKFTECTPGNCVGEIAISSYGNNVLIENNNISHVGDYTNIWGQYVILRNNLFHATNVTDFPQYDYAGGDPAGHHLDGLQYFSTGITFRYVLMENNTFFDCHLYNCHIAILRDTSYLGDSDLITRYNLIYMSGAFGTNPFRKVKAFHNTVVNAVNVPYVLNVTNGTFGNFASVYSTRGRNAFDFIDSYNITILNNIFYNSTKQDAQSGPYSFSNTTETLADYNLANLSGTSGFNDVHGITSDPLFVSYNSTSFYSSNFSLQSTSPAINSAGQLTNVSVSDTGTGTSLIVNDAGFFQDGWGMTNRGVQADWIAIGSVTNIVQISSINYTSNNITLNQSISRNDGDPIWLYKDSSGRRVLYGNAPDIGAFEYVSSTAVVLNSPPNYQNTTNSTAVFNCTADSGVNLTNITLYGNWTGAWQANQTTNINGTSNTTTFTKTLSEGLYIWNCLAYNNESSFGWGSSNFTIKIDSTSPILTINQPSSSVSASSVSFNITLNEDGNTILLSLNAGIINYTMQRNGNRDFNFTNSSIADGTYTVNFYANDTSGNLNRTANKTFVVDTSTPSSSGGSSGGGGGGGGGTAASYWLNTYSYSDEELEKKVEITKELSERNRIKFKVNGEDHHLGIIAVSNKTVLINISSNNTQQALLSIGEEKNFEITGDNYYDIVVKLNSIFNNSANLTIKAIAGLVPENADVIFRDEGIEPLASGSKGSENISAFFSKFKDFVTKFRWPILAILGILLLAAFVFYIIKKTKRKIESMYDLKGNSRNKISDSAGLNQKSQAP